MTEPLDPQVAAKSFATVRSRLVAIANDRVEPARYHLDDHSTDSAEVADIRSGTGYLDLALDLSRLAKLYQKHQNIIKKDPKNYVASDIDDARKYSSEILRLLGDARNENAKTWADMVARASNHPVRPKKLHGSLDRRS